MSLKPYKQTILQKNMFAYLYFNIAHFIDKNIFAINIKI